MRRPPSGAVGQALTPLTPAGNVEVDGESYPARSVRGEIAVGRRVVVTGFDPWCLFVRELVPERATEAVRPPPPGESSTPQEPNPFAGLATPEKASSPKSSLTLTRFLVCMSVVFVIVILLLLGGTLALIFLVAGGGLVWASYLKDKGAEVAPLVIFLCVVLVVAVLATWSPLGTGLIHWGSSSSARPCISCLGSGRVAFGPCPICEGKGRSKLEPTAPCKECRGTGRVTMTCPRCRGTGQDPFELPP
jgi:hypothetical protein